MDLPQLPNDFEDVTRLIEEAKNQQEVIETIRPYKEYESQLRRIFAQEPLHDATKANHLTPVFGGGATHLTIKGRDLAAESVDEKERFVLPLEPNQRRDNGSLATVQTIKDFKSNFNVFSESALVDLDWNNVVAAGSSVVTALLPVNAPHNASKRALRSYYHEQLAPASDVDLFIYGLDEEAAAEKIKQIETKIKDAILSETTVVRAKNTVTIVAEYPIRHIQIVLRLYKSITEILTGFDVDCACVAFDGEEVWAAPRALAAFATQVNSVDLTRRSPSYENRLAKYSHRGFEVFWPLLNRSRVDPTIFERAFNRVQGLARLLVLEKLPHPQDRDEYLAQRRKERGRPELPWNARFRHQLPGNVKDVQPHDVAEWVDEGDVSSYHTFSIPWGPRYTPKKIEKLLYAKDLLLNAEWNKPKDREANLHRHPAFFGTVDDVIEDCCRFCPEPTTDADLAVLEEESKTFISGKLSFLKDNPGRQEIGSFNPITDDDWTEMAYVGNTSRLCQAIVDCDLDAVKDWFGSEEADCNRRDHTGRTPLQLAALCGTPEIVQHLIEHGARIVARLYSGLTALHIAAHRGNTEIVKLLLDKSAQNQIDEDKKEDARKTARRAALTQKGNRDPDIEMNDGESFQNVEDLMDEDTENEAGDMTTEGSFVKVGREDQEPAPEDETDEPDIYDVDVVAWDSPVSALHLAILAGHHEVITVLIEKYGADVLLPVKLMTDDVPREPRAAILTLLLPLQLPLRRANETVKLLLEKGATPTQGDMSHRTILDYAVKEVRTSLLDIFKNHDPSKIGKMLNRLTISGYHLQPQVESPLLAALKTRSPELVNKLLELGASPIIDLEAFAKAYRAQFDHVSGSTKDPDEIQKYFNKHVTQPVVQAAKQEGMMDFVLKFVDAGADVNTLTTETWQHIEKPDGNYHNVKAESILDILRHRRWSLENYLKVEPKHTATLKEVEQLENDDHYLENLPNGSYQQWTAQNDLRNARYIQQKRAKKFLEEFENANRKDDELPGEAEKKEAISAMIQKHRDIERQVIAKGAKKFYELYPQLKRKRKEHPYQQPMLSTAVGPGIPFSIKFKFHIADLTPAMKEAYVRLFEAVWRNDQTVVKSLCLSTKNDVPPLLVAVRDSNGFNPFSLSVLRGHFDLAQVILDIATVQLEEKVDTQEVRYSMFPSQQNADDDSEISNEDDHPEFYARLVDDKFTINDVYANTENLKSRVKPFELINQPCEIWRTSHLPVEEAKNVFDVDGKSSLQPYHFRSYNHRDGKDEKPWEAFHNCVSDEHRISSDSLWKYAVVTNDVKMLRFLFQMQMKYAMADEDELLNKLAFSNDLFEIALRRGLVEMVGEIIRSRGQYLPLERLAAKSGIKIEVKPKYYQGLSVYGQKRKDWADQQRGIYHSVPSEESPPLLKAVLQSNVEMIEYFLTDAPLRRYEEFAALFKDDNRVKSLARSKMGIRGALNKWLEARSNLILHLVLESWPAGSAQRLEFLLDKAPESYLEARTPSGETPLHTALRLGNWPAFEILINAGADQSVRNKKGRNLLHTFYEMMTEPNSHLQLFRYFISLLDVKAIPSLIQQRCSDHGPGGMTPFAVFLLHAQPTERNIEIMDAMLEVSAERELTIMNGSGDYPLHDECRGHDNILALHLAKRRPDLLFMENATGLTPIEVAQIKYFQDCALRERYGAVPDDTSSIIDRSAQTFIPPNDEEKREQEKKARERQEEDERGDIPTSSPLYRDLVKIARAKPGKRKLISLLDSNEVAKRLAAQQARKNEDARRREAQGLSHKTRSRYVDDYEMPDYDPSRQSRKQNEVEEWFVTSAERWRRIDWDIHVRDETESIDIALEKLRDFAYAKTESWRCCEKAGERGHAKVVKYER